MAEEWYYSTAQGEHGPVSSLELQLLARQGKLQPTDSVWKAGADQRLPAGKVKGLFPTRAEPPPLPKTTRSEPPPLPKSSDRVRLPASKPSGQSQGNTRLMLWLAAGTGAILLMCCGTWTASLVLLKSTMPFPSSLPPDANDSATGMGLSDSRVLGEGTQIGTLDDTVRRHLKFTLAKTKETESSRCWQVGSTVLEMHGPRHDLHTVVIRTQASELGNSENLLGHMTLLMHTLSAIFNPEKEMGKMDPILKWMRQELDLKHSRGEPSHEATKIVDGRQLRLNSNTSEQRVEIRGATSRWQFSAVIGCDRCAPTTRKRSRL